MTDELTNELTEEQISGFKDAFSLFDKDGDGSITVVELKTVMKSLDLNPTDEELEKMIQEVDLDGNGEIDFDEFLIMMAQMVRNFEMEEHIRGAFRLFDTDNDGLIRKEELAHVLLYLGDGEKKEIEEIVDYADTDGDGIIKYEYLIKLITSHQNCI